MFGLTDDQIAIRDAAREFARNEIVPFAAEWDRAGAGAPDIAAKMGQQGFFGICISQDFGGAGADFTSYALVTEELAYGDAGTCNIINATNNYCLKVRDFGTEAQKNDFLRPVASGGYTGCMLLTEPQAGSDAAGIQTKAVLKGDRYIVNGTKIFITSGDSAGAAVLVAVTDPSAGKRGISAFLIRPGQKGYHVVGKEKKLGHRTNSTCQIALENLEIPIENMLGKPGEGLKVALSGLDSGRIACAAQSVGVARAAFDAAVSYAKERETFKKKIIEHQAIAFMLADMATDIEVAKQMFIYTSSLKNAGVRCIKQASMCKLFASRMSEKVCSAAIQIHGGYGYINDYRVEKYYRDARLFQLYDGTNEIQKLLISREIALGN